MLDNVLTKDCRKLLKAVIKLNNEGIEYPCMEDLLYTLPNYTHSELMSIAKHCQNFGFVHVDWVDGSTIALIENTYMGNHYIKTRGVENFRFWFPVMLSVISIIVSILALFISL